MHETKGISVLLKPSLKTVSRLPTFFFYDHPKASLLLSEVSSTHRRIVAMVLCQSSGKRAQSETIKGFRLSCPRQVM